MNLCDCLELIPSLDEKVIVSTMTSSGEKIAEGEVKNVSINKIEFHCNTPILFRGNETNKVYSRVKMTGKDSFFVVSSIKINNGDVTLDNICLVSKSELRRETRTPMSFPVLINDKTMSEGDFLGEMKNLSLSGILVKSPVKLEVGSNIDITLKLPEDYDFDMTLTYRVVRTMLNDCYGCMGDFNNKQRIQLQQMISKYSYEKLHEMMSVKYRYN